MIINLIGPPCAGKTYYAKKLCLLSGKKVCCGCACKGKNKSKKCGCGGKVRQCKVKCCKRECVVNGCRKTHKGY